MMLLIRFAGTWPKRTVLRVLNIKLTSFLLVITVLGSFFMDQYQDFFNRILIFGRSGSVLRNKNSIRIR